MVQIRPYNVRDSVAAGILIADCYTKYVLDFVPKRQFADYLGPFFMPAHQTRPTSNRLPCLFRQPSFLLPKMRMEI